VKKVDVRPDHENAGEWIFTLELDFYRATLLASPMLDYSSRNGWDVQIASYNIPVYGGGGSGAGDSYINLSKTFVLSKTFKALLGSQNGTTLLSSLRQYHNFDYGLLIWQPDDSWNIHAGPYFANAALSGIGNTVGYTIGFSVDFIEDTLTLQGDYYSGHASLSSTMLNLFYTVSPGVQTYLGIGIPAPNSGGEFYGALGFVLSSKAF